MGFGISLAMFCPEQWTVRDEGQLPLFGNNFDELRARLPSKTITVWQPWEIVSFGYITRMDKLLHPEKYGGRVFRAVEVAGIATFSIIYRELTAKLKDWKLSDFPPRFDISDDDEEFVPHNTILCFEKARDGEEYTSSPAYLATDSAHLTDAFEVKFRQHNTQIENLARKDAEAVKYMNEGYDPIRDTPFMWASCEELAAWLDEAETEQKVEWLELQKYPEALARTRGWREYFREMGAARARVMFYEPRLI